MSWALSSSPSAMIPTSKNLKTLCCRLHNKPARKLEETRMKRLEGFKQTVSKPRARLSTEIIILFWKENGNRYWQHYYRVYRYIPITVRSIFHTKHNTILSQYKQKVMNNSWLIYVKCRGETDKKNSCSYTVVSGFSMVGYSFHTSTKKCLHVSPWY